MNSRSLYNYLCKVQVKLLDFFEFRITSLNDLKSSVAYVQTAFYYQLVDLKLFLLTATSPRGPWAHFPTFNAKLWQLYHSGYHTYESFCQQCLIQIPGM